MIRFALSIFCSSFLTHQRCSCSSWFSVGFLIYYPAKRLSFGDFSIPWLCAHGLPAPYCFETLTSRSLTDEVDLGRVFGVVSSDTCDVVSVGADDAGDTPDSSPEGSGGSTFASTTITAALVLFVSLIMGLLW